MTPKELIKELRAIVKVHPEVADHTIFAGKLPVQVIRWDQRKKRIILE